MWPPQGGRTLNDVQHDDAQTIMLTVMLIESEQHAFNWLEPRDLSVGDAVALLESDLIAKQGHGRASFFYQYLPSRHVGFADGSVRVLPSYLPHQHLTEYFTIDDDNQSIQSDLHQNTDRRKLRVDNCIRLGIYVFLIVLPAFFVRRRYRMLNNADATN